MEARSQLGVLIEWFTSGIPLPEEYCINFLGTMDLLMSVFSIPMNLLLDLVVVTSRFILGRYET
jgi:hypothetical protein